MKISETTLDILHNFCSLRESIFVEAGSRLFTRTFAGDVVAEANVEEEFPVDFAIADLKQFLGTINMFEDPDLVFDEKFVTIESDESKVKYYYAAPTVVRREEKTRPKELVKFAELTMTKDTIAQILKMSAMLGLPHVNFFGKGTKCIINVSDEDNDSSNDFRTVVEGDSVDGINFSYDRNHFQMLASNDYNLQFDERGICKLEAVGKDLRYWIANKAGD